MDASRLLAPARNFLIRPAVSGDAHALMPDEWALGRWRQVAELAARQFGVVSRRQLLDLGVPDSTITRWAKEERMLRLHRGVFAVGHDHLPPNGRYLAATLAGEPGSVITRRSAGAHWGVRQTLSPRVDVAVVRSRRPVPGIRWHQVKLHPEDATVHEGVPVITPARTLLDLAALLDRRGLTKALARADQLRLLDAQAVRATYRRNPAHHGAARLLKAFDDYQPSLSRTRSGVEVVACELCREAGLPVPVINGIVETDIGELELDLVWREHRAAMEIDTFGTHGTVLAFETDRQRDAAVVRAGWRNARATDRTIEKAPQTFIATVEATGRRQRSLLNAR